MPGEGRREGVGEERRGDKDSRNKARACRQRGSGGGNKGASVGDFLAGPAMVLVCRVSLLERRGKVARRHGRRYRQGRLVKMALNRNAVKKECQQRKQRDEPPCGGLFQGKAG